MGYFLRHFTVQEMSPTLNALDGLRLLIKDRYTGRRLEKPGYIGILPVGLAGSVFRHVFTVLWRAEHRSIYLPDLGIASAVNNYSS